MTGRRLHFPLFLLGTEGLVKKKRACQSSEPESKDQNCLDFYGVSEVKKATNLDISNKVAEF